MSKNININLCYEITDSSSLKDKEYHCTSSLNLGEKHIHIFDSSRSLFWRWAVVKKTLSLTDFF